MSAPRTGDKAPPFELLDGAGKARSLDDFLGAPLILYFYPADFTPGCTKEACSFQDRMEEFGGHGATVVGISRDSPRKHAKFAERYGLDFPLLSDRDGSVHAAYGATGLLGRRTTFVIDSKGIVVDRIQSPLPATHIKRALASLAGAAA